MRDYVKPMIIANEELAEGVYAGSGTSATSAVTAAATIKSNNGTDTAYFDVTFSNKTNEDVTNWSATITFSSTVKDATVYNCNVSINGNTITVTPAHDWNATIAANGTWPSSGYGGGYVIGSTVLAIQ